VRLAHRVSIKVSFGEIVRFEREIAGAQCCVAKISKTVLDMISIGQLAASQRCAEQDKAVQLGTP
jgi:hypothetical protein